MEEQALVALVATPGPHVETARGLIGASSLLVRIHERVHPVISKQFEEKKNPK